MSMWQQPDICVCAVTSFPPFYSIPFTRGAVEGVKAGSLLALGGTYGRVGVPMRDECRKEAIDSAVNEDFTEYLRK